MFDGQANGQMITTGADGGRVLMDKPLPSREIILEIAEQNRQSRIDSAMQSVSVLQLKLQAGRKITAAETSRLNAVLDYIDEVNAVDTSSAADINWPEKP
ncbi:tail fiber assembly protein [Erwinia sp.]|uniref:tail fiber assembly protein n=1 Tax=Erwinia citreus TaxID=558 RepID=UPI00289C011C|nr:tail fiber assembly protein [Erwinia sp.]